MFHLYHLSDQIAVRLTEIIARDNISRSHSNNKIQGLPNVSQLGIHQSNHQLSFQVFQTLNPYVIQNLQQTTLKTSRQKHRKSLYMKNNNWIDLKTWWHKKKLLVLSNFFICRHVFKKLSAAGGVRKSLYEGKG